jgi:oligopeptide transport system substrate-binding protein
MKTRPRKGPMVVINRGNGAEPASLDPHRASGTWENNVIGDMFLGLYTEGPDGAPIFGAAVSHETSDDGLVHTFRLREGLLWSDGVPVTANDFVYGLRRIVDPLTAARYAFIVYIVENAQEINGGQMETSELGARAIDDMTLEITLTRPAPFLPWLLTHYTMFAVPQHAIEEYGDDWTRADNMVSNGAYTLSQWVPNDHITLAKNPRFYDAGNVAVDEVIFYPTDDESAALRRFRAGELDLNTGFPSQQYAWLQEHMPEETHVVPYFSTSYILFNMEREIFQDPRVRRALSMSVHREVITDIILANGQVPTYSLNPPLMPDYAPPELDFAIDGEVTPEVVNARVEEAQALMREAGYGPDNPLHFTYRYMEGVDARRVAVALAGWWEQIYANVDIVNTEPAVHYRDLQTRNYDMGAAGWIADYPDPENYLLLFHSESGALNYSGYDSEEYESLLNQAQQTADADERGRLYQEAETILLTDSPFIPTSNSVSKTLVGQHIVGYEDNGVHIHRTRWMSIDESQRPEQTSVIDSIRGLFN